MCCSLYQYITVWYTGLMGKWIHCVTTHGISISFLPIFIFDLCLCIQNININMGKLLHMDCIHIWFVEHNNFSSLRVTWLLKCRHSNPDLFLFSAFNYDESSHMKFWMIGSSQNWVLYFIWSERGVFPCLQYEFPF